MKVSTNGPKPKKKNATPGKTVTVFKMKPADIKVKPTFKKGDETSTYTPKRELGHKVYGPENPANKDPEFIEEARRKKQDIAYDKEGKPYRAGVTTTTKAADKFGSDVTVGKPNISIEKKTVYTPPKPTGGKTGKLKPMGMTYGTDDPKKGGGTKYKLRVRPK